MCRFNRRVSCVSIQVSKVCRFNRRVSCVSIQVYQVCQGCQVSNVCPVSPFKKHCCTATSSSDPCLFIYRHASTCINLYVCTYQSIHLYIKQKERVNALSPSALFTNPPTQSIHLSMHACHKSNHACMDVCACTTVCIYACTTISIYHWSSIEITSSPTTTKRLHMPVCPCLPLCLVLLHRSPSRRSAS